MFENFKKNLKIKDFRSDGIKVDSYDPNEQTITLSTRKGRSTELAFKLVHFDDKFQLAFSGDIITSDGEALARVMKVMWNYELPASFSDDEALFTQIFGNNPEQESADVTATMHVDKPHLYFRDMYGAVAGMPNEVIVTVKASFRIDN